MSNEPYFYDSSYRLVKREFPIPINGAGQCVVANEIEPEEGSKGTKMWECSVECKQVTDAEIAAIVSLRAAFDTPMHDLRHALEICDDGCLNQHYTEVLELAPIPVEHIDTMDDGRLTDYYPVALQGHPLVCSNNSGCQSKLRVLRAASTHYPVLRKFLHQLSNARTSYRCIHDIDQALCAGQYCRLMEITESNGFESLISNDVESSYEQCTDVAGGKSFLRQPNLEAQLLITHAELISQLENEVQDFPEHACCSCERLHQRKSLTRVNLSDELSHDVWPQVKSYILEQNPDAGDHVLFMCKYCRHMIKQNKLPPRCVINGLQVVPMPPELSALDSLSIQLIQRAK